MILTANTIDLPLKSSGEFLSKWGRYGKRDSDLLTDDAAYSGIMASASVVQKAILEGLSEQLGLKGDDRVMNAYQQTRSGGNDGRSRGRRSQSRPEAPLKAKIARDLKRRWPALANVVNPVAIELITARQTEFIQAVEKHRDYAEYRRLAQTEANSAQKKKVKFERFLRTIDNVIFAENLRREKRIDLIKQYETIVTAERRTLFE